MPIATPLHTGTPEGITFDVSDVILAKTPLPTVKTQNAVATLLGGKVEVACDYTDECVEGIDFNPLIAAAKIAHDQHRPLVLSPDIIWLTLCQGLSFHIEKRWSDFRDAILVDPVTPIHAINVSTEEFPFGSPEIPWDELIAEATNQVRERINADFASLFRADFTTSRHVDQIAFDVALLEAVSNEFTVIDSPWCGIPNITLTGAPEDWEKISHRLESFRQYGMDWWVTKIANILTEFCAASRGATDVSFWSQLYSVSQPVCGKDRGVTGWIGKLFPFLQSTFRGNFKNPLVTGEGEIPTVEFFPSGIRSVKMRSQRGTIVNLVGGLVGLSQDPISLGLKPKVGWAMLRTDQFGALLQRVSESPWCVAPYNNPGSPPIDICNPILQRLYRRFSSLRISNCNGTELLSFVPRHEMTGVDPRMKKSSKAPLLCTGKLAGRYRLLTRTVNGMGPFERLSSHVFPFFFAEVGGEYRFVCSNLDAIVAYYLDVADGTEEPIPIEDIGPVVDPMDQKQLYAIMQKANAVRRHRDA